MSRFSNLDNAFKNNSLNDFDYNTVTIKPPARNKTHGTITKTLVIDSRDRDFIKFPDSNSFRVEITEEFRDVTSLELVYGQIPNCNYNINKNNNMFYISENNEVKSVEIPEGQYTNQHLLDTLNGNNGNLLKDLEHKYNFTRNVNNLKIRIQSNNPDNFIYNLNYELNNNCSPCQFKSMDTKLGFLNKAYHSEIIDLSYIYVNKNNIVYQNKSSLSDYKVYKISAISNTNKTLDFKEIFMVNDYIILNGGNIKYSCRIHNILNENTIEIESLDNNNPIALFGNIFQNINLLYSPNIYNVENKPYLILKVAEAKLLTSLTSTCNNSYTVISLEQKNNTLINQATLPEHGVIKYFNPPLGKLFWLDIQFLNYDGTLADFKGQDLMLTFVISQLNQPGKYNNIIDSW
jgi:hypothetical protein